MSQTAQEFGRPIKYNETDDINMFDDVLESQSYGESEIQAERHVDDHKSPHEFRRAQSYERNFGDGQADDYEESREVSRDHVVPDNYRTSYNFEGSENYNHKYNHYGSYGNESARLQRELGGGSQSNSFHESRSYSGFENQSSGFANQSSSHRDRSRYESTQGYEGSAANHNWTTSKLHSGASGGAYDPWEYSGYPSYGHYPNDEELDELFDDDLSDVPSFDELPSILYLTGDVDEKTMKRSMHLYNQKMRLKKIQEMNESKGTVHRSHTQPEFRSSQIARNKNKNIKVNIKQSEFAEKKGTVNDLSRTDLNKPSDRKRYEQVRDMTDEEMLGISQDNEGENVMEDMQTDLIRQKRIEKLEQMSTEKKEYKNTERKELKPHLFENDNRMTMMKEDERMLKKKTETPVDKERKLKVSASNMGTTYFKPHRQGDTKHEDKKKHNLERNKTNSEHNVSGNVHAIENIDLFSPDQTNIGQKVQQEDKLEPDSQRTELVTDEMNESTDEDDIPYVMKLLNDKREKQMQKTKRKKGSDTSSSSNKADFYEDSEDPFSIFGERGRKLKEILTTARKTNKNKETNAEETEEDELAHLPAFSVIFLPPKETDRRNNAKSKPPIKNKNKNAKPISTGANNLKPKSEARVNETVVAPGATTKKTSTEKPAVSKAQTPQTGNRAEKQAVLKLKLNNVGERRAQAFKNIKQKHYQSGVHCSSCGRSDCNSMHVQKMKEMIRAARQTGFDVIDVTPDGNCMFAAVVDQLEFYGNYTYISRSLREAAVNWLIENPNSEDGTPYCSFLEEDWQTYLQRMLGEGQWGDHIVLRAIVQVIGHTVKVFNVGEGEGHWTMIESKHARPDEDDQPIILGQLGEFHFVSLRPSDHGTNTEDFHSVTDNPANKTSDDKEDLKNIKLEGGESVAMFDECYVDEESGLPALHLSYLLKKIYPRSLIDNAAINASSWEERSREFETQDHDVILTGEFGNRVHVGFPFGGESYVRCCRRFKKMKVTRLDDFQSYEIGLCLDESNVHQGYAKIVQISPMGRNYLATPKTASATSPPMVKEGESESISTSDVRLKPVYVWGTNSCGCTVWPRSALSWKTRQRYEGWPPEEVINSIVDTGCILIPAAHKHSQDPGIEWTIGFDLAEKTLFREAVTSSQRYCYIVWKSFIMQIADLSGPLTYDHLRSTFLYCCERIPAEFWTSNPGACVMYMFDEILRCIKEKHLPNYFVSTNNMLDYFTQKELADIEEKIITVRNQPITFIQQFHDTCHFVYGGSKLIRLVQDDIYRFQEHQSVRRSTIEVFVPASIDLAQEFLKNGGFGTGFNMLSETFEERLSVSTCDDTLPYHLFLQNALNGLNQPTLVWFSAYAEYQLKGQLPNQLIQDVQGDQELVKIKEAVPQDVAGEFADTLVPKSSTHNFFEFLNEFALFLRSIGKTDAVLIVLHHGHESYKTMLANLDEVHESENTWEFPVMLIYTGLYMVYAEQGQEAKFKDIYPYIEGLAARLKCINGYMWLSLMYSCMKEEEKSAQVKDKFLKNPKQGQEELGGYYLAKVIKSWQVKSYSTSY